MGRPRSGEDGFTIVEVMVAAVVLLVGILGVTTIVNTSNATTTSNKAREQGLALAREMIESARSVRYQNLRPANAVSTVQAMPGLGDAGGDGWTIQRRGITFSVSLGVCSVDDPSDGTGAHVANSFCARSSVSASADTCKALIGTPASISGTGGSAGLDGADCGLDTNLDGAVDGLVQSTASACPAGTSVPAGTCDAQPDDFKRLVVLVTWDRGSGNRYVLQQATESFPGLSAYAGITSLELHNAGPAPSGGYVIAPSGGSNVSALQFDATSSEPANQVDWLLNGADQGPASWSSTSGNFTWSLGNDAPASETEPATGEVVDGSYTIGARVQDASGIHGTELDTTVTLNRRIPFKPKGLTALVQSNGSVLLAWIAPADQDIVGYDVLRSVGGGTPGTFSGCTGVATTSCTDSNPPSSGTVTYYVHALDRDPTTGGSRAGQDSASASVSTGSSATSPAAPGPLSITVVKTTGKKVTIKVSWPAVTGTPTVTQYGIWRDTQTGSPATISATSSPYYQDTFFSTESHTYYVVSIANGVMSKTTATITYTP